MFDQAAASVQELQTVVMRLLSQIGGDWDGVDTGTRRPASDEAGEVAALVTALVYL